MENIFLFLTYGATISHKEPGGAARPTKSATVLLLSQSGDVPPGAQTDTHKCTDIQRCRI